eukprot:12015117-Prorocentrum_lima.AAC.1
MTRRQQASGRMTRVLDVIQLLHLWGTLPQTQQETLLSAGGPMAGLPWLLGPHRGEMRFSNANWITA